MIASPEMKRAARLAPEAAQDIARNILNATLALTKAQAGPTLALLLLQRRRPQPGRDASCVHSPQGVDVIMNGDPVEQFRGALQRRAILPPNQIIADGRLHHCDAEGRNGKGDAAYVLHLEGLLAGGFENWRDGLGWQNWRAHEGRPQAIVEAEAHRATVASMRAEREAREAQRYVKAHVRAAAPLGAAIADALHRSLRRWPQ